MKYPKEMCLDCETETDLQENIDKTKYKVQKFECPRCGRIHEMAIPK